MKKTCYLSVLLFTLLAMPLVSYAHCKGKHTGDHEHCTGGEDPPPSPPPNSALTFKGGKSDGIYVMDIDGSNTRKLGGGKQEDTRNVAWFPDGSGVVWTERRFHGNSVEARIKYWDRNTDSVSIVFTPTTLVDPWLGDNDTIETAIDGCGGTDQRLVYFLPNSKTVPDIVSFDVDNSSSLNVVAVDPNLGFGGLAVSKDGLLLATFTISHIDPTAPARLEIRNICAEGAPILWSWTVDELGISSDNWIHMNEMDWSHDFRLAVAQENEDIWLIDPFPLSGTVTAERLTGPGTEFGVGVAQVSPTWSPDNSLIAFGSEGVIYTIDVSSREINQVSDKQVYQVDWRDNWTPNQ